MVWVSRGFAHRTLMRVSITPLKMPRTRSTNGEPTDLESGRPPQRVGHYVEVNWSGESVRREVCSACNGQEGAGRNRLYVKPISTELTITSSDFHGPPRNLVFTFTLISCGA